MTMTCWIVDFVILADHRVKTKENETTEKMYIFFFKLRNYIVNWIKRTKKAIDHEGGSDINCNWCTQNTSQRLDKRPARVRNWRTSQDHSNYRIKINQNTVKSPGDLKRLAVTPTPAKDHLLTLVLKTCDNKWK